MNDPEVQIKAMRAALVNVVGALQARVGGRPWALDDEKRAIAQAAPYAALPKPKPVEFR